MIHQESECVSSESCLSDKMFHRIKRWCTYHLEILVCGQTLVPAHNIYQSCHSFDNFKCMNSRIYSTVYSILIMLNLPWKQFEIVLLKVLGLGIWKSSTIHSNSTQNYLQ
jgi:hypothetical protein